MNIFKYLRLFFLLRPYVKRYKKNLKFSQKMALQNPLIKLNNQRKKVLVCMHSFEWGGAERFAYETIKFLKENNCDFLIFVEKRTQIADYFLDVIGNVLIVYAENYQKSECQLTELIAEQKPNIIYIHHSWSAYNALKVIPRDIFVIDSLHIIEYQTGGYPCLSAKNSCYINIHHVVSQGLKRYLMNDLGVAPYKIEVASLVRDLAVSSFKKETSHDRFVIGFLGRFEKQKRPELFLELARILLMEYGNRLHFIMQGDGSLKANIHQLIDKYGLKNIEVLSSSDNIASFYKKIDVLVNCSENEGLTLVGIESAQYNTIFVSTDVGQQNEIVSDVCLMNPAPLSFVIQANNLIQRLMDNIEFQNSILGDQKEKFEILMNQSFRKNVLEKYL